MSADVFKLTQESFTAYPHLEVIKHTASFAQRYMNFPPQVFLIVSILNTNEEEESGGAKNLLEWIHIVRDKNV